MSHGLKHLFYVAIFIGSFTYFVRLIAETFGSACRQFHVGEVVAFYSITNEKPFEWITAVRRCRSSYFCMSFKQEDYSKVINNANLC